MFSAKVTNKLIEIQKDVLAVYKARKELQALLVEQDALKNKIVFKTNEITECESRITRGHNALSILLSEDKGD